MHNLSCCVFECTICHDRTNGQTNCNESLLHSKNYDTVEKRKERTDGEQQKKVNGWARLTDWMTDWQTERTVLCSLQSSSRWQTQKWEEEFSETFAVFLNAQFVMLCFWMYNLSWQDKRTDKCHESLLHSKNYDTVKKRNERTDGERQKKVNGALGPANRLNDRLADWTNCHLQSTFQQQVTNT